MKVLVTRDSINVMLMNSNSEFVMHVVGKALVGIFNRQTEDEKQVNSTTKHNGIGFSGSDAKGGSLSAKFYIKHKRLEPWMVLKWTKVSERTGYPRLCKYHTQLNEIANQKAERRSN